jgi:hypothetical protein
LNPFRCAPTQGEFEQEQAMRFGLPAAVLAIVISVSGPASAAVCQAKSITADEIIEAINAAPGCEPAMKLFQDCSFGASGDVQLGEAVEKKCEGDFLSRLKAPQKRAYRREMALCDRKYRNESGTMYRSFTAFCRAEVAQRYSQRALKAASPIKGPPAL